MTNEQRKEHNKQVGQQMAEVFKARYRGIVDCTINEDGYLNMMASNIRTLNSIAMDLAFIGKVATVKKADKSNPYAKLHTLNCKVA